MTNIAHEAIDRAWGSLTHLATATGPRVAGSPRERAVVEYIADAFRSRGLTTHSHPFRYVGWQSVSSPSVEIQLSDDTNHSLRCAPMAYTGNTPVGGVAAILRVAGVCELVPGLLGWPRFAVEANGVVSAYIAVVPEGCARPFPRPDRQLLLLLEPIVIVWSDQFQEIEERLHRGEPVKATVEPTDAMSPDTTPQTLSPTFPAPVLIQRIPGHSRSAESTPWCRSSSHSATFMYPRTLPRTITSRCLRSRFVLPSGWSNIC